MEFGKAEKAETACELRQKQCYDVSPDHGGVVPTDVSAPAGPPPTKQSLRSSVSQTAKGECIICGAEKQSQKTHRINESITMCSTKTAFVTLQNAAAVEATAESLVSCCVVVVVLWMV